jgi:hypothetical protein
MTTPVRRLIEELDLELPEMESHAPDDALAPRLDEEEW